MPRLFGEKIRALRRGSHLTQAQLAQQLGLATQSHLSYLENGKSAPSIHFVTHIARVLHVTVDYLLRDTIPTHPPLTSATEPLDTGDLARQFGERVRIFRLQRNMSQIQLAELLHPISQAHISFLETGHKTPSIDIVLRCADLFEVTADELLYSPSTKQSNHL
jgi:transcriptional regulator with XRE-family HTH domain